MIALLKSFLNRPGGFLLIFFMLLIFRTLYGLSLGFWGQDEIQTYLIGLKWFTTGQWPYFGPDLIVDETGYYKQIPGALEALLIGTPWYLLPIPETPWLVLNFISLSGIAFFSWYLAPRLPNFSFMFIFAWLSLIPWNLMYSVHVMNPSYLLFGSCLFFIGFFESVPSLSLSKIPTGLAFALMGFGLLWDYQFHFSWVYLAPFVIFSLGSAFYQGGWKGLKSSLYFGMGMAPMAALLIPTFLKYGFSQFWSGSGTSVWFNPSNFRAFPAILARYLSFACFEIPRMLGGNTAERMVFLKQAPWAAPPAFFLTLVGWIQPILLLGYWFVKAPKPREYFKWTSILTLVMIFVSFWFTYKPPRAHIYYILSPVVIVWSLLVWNELSKYKWARGLAFICLAAEIWLQGGFIINQLPNKSLYTNRALVVKAIQNKNYHLLGERRPQSFY